MVGGDAVARSAALRTWWSWEEDGSRPFHWQWPEEYCAMIRDGLPVYFLQTMHPYRFPQGDKKGPVTKAQLVSKLQKACDRRYIAVGQVDSLTAFFAVKKGDDDVRL
jgi:hypothetical protein